MEVTGMSQGGQQPLVLNTSSGYTSFVFGNGKSSLDLKHEEIIEKRDVQTATDEMNKLMDDSSTHLKFEVYGKFKDIVVRVIDDDTNEVVREVPPKQIIDMIDKFCEMSGFFMDERA